MSGLAAALQAAKLKKTNGPKTSSGSPGSANDVSNGNARYLDVKINNHYGDSWNNYFKKFHFPATMGQLEEVRVVVAVGWLP